MKVNSYCAFLQSCNYKRQIQSNKNNASKTKHTLAQKKAEGQRRTILKKIYIIKSNMIKLNKLFCVFMQLNDFSETDYIYVGCKYLLFPLY